MKSDLVVLGDINIDILGSIDAMPRVGGCAFGITPSIHAGGAGLNTAFAAKRLGLATVLVSKIGLDFWGDWAIRTISENGFDVRTIVRTKSYPTGTVFVAVAGGERTFFAFRKNAADNHMLPSDLEGISLDSGNVFLSGTAVFEGAESFDTYLGLIEDLHSRGSRVFFDPNSRPEGTEHSARIEKILRFTDVFLPGESELRLMLGGGPEEAIIESILALGVSEIWIKRGAKGSELATRKGRMAFPPVPAATIDTTGAGDAYDGCIAWGHVRKLPIEKIGMYANAYAAMTTESIGAGEIFPTQHQFMSGTQYLSVEGEERCVE